MQDNCAILVNLHCGDMEATCDGSFDDAGNVSLLDEGFVIHLAIVVQEAWAAVVLQFGFEKGKLQLGKAGKTGKASDFDCVIGTLHRLLQHLNFTVSLPATEPSERGGRQERRQAR